MDLNPLMPMKKADIIKALIKKHGLAVRGSTSDLPYLFRQLEKLTAKETADLSTLIQKWISTH